MLAGVWQGGRESNPLPLGILLPSALPVSYTPPIHPSETSLPQVQAVPAVPRPLGTKYGLQCRGCTGCFRDWPVPSPTPRGTAHPAICPHTYAYA